jgi:dTDP-4-dehydrorhamnose reductase
MLNHKKILITGSNGMLGSSITKEFIDKIKIVFTPSESELDITNYSQVNDYIDKTEPDILINCAAYTAVDKCEEDKVHYAVNGDSLKNLSAKCALKKIKLVHYSTDYIFSGLCESPISEEEPTSPINEYGKGKLLGEINIRENQNLDYLIFRVQWLFGKNGKNFVDTILRLSKEKKELRVVGDQWGRPTSTIFLAKILYEALEKDLNGVYNLGANDFCSWYDLACFITENTDCKIIKIPSSEYPLPAKRPLYSVLSLEKITRDLEFSKNLQTSWKDLVREFISSK